MGLLLLDDVGRDNLLDGLVAELEVFLDRGGVLDLDPDDGSGDQERGGTGGPLTEKIQSLACHVKCAL